MVVTSNEEHGHILHGIHGFFNGSYRWGLAPPNPSFMPELAICMLFFWNYVINSLYLRESMLLSYASLFTFYKVSQACSGFLLIPDFLRV
jgi:hypothetical protein